MAAETCVDVYGPELVSARFFHKCLGGRDLGSPSPQTINARALAPSQSNRFVKKPGLPGDGPWIPIPHAASSSFAGVDAGVSAPRADDTRRSTQTTHPVPLPVQAGSRLPSGSSRRPERVLLVFLGYLLDRFDALERIQGCPGFELWIVSAAFWFGLHWFLGPR
jgi:hypothetical protein